MVLMTIDLLSSPYLKAISALVEVLSSGKTTLARTSKPIWPIWIFLRTKIAYFAPSFWMLSS